MFGKTKLVNVLVSKSMLYHRKLCALVTVGGNQKATDPTFSHSFQPASAFTLGWIVTASFSWASSSFNVVTSLDKLSIFPAAALCSKKWDREIQFQPPWESVQKQCISCLRAPDFASSLPGVTAWQETPQTPPLSFFSPPLPSTKNNTKCYTSMV